MSTSPTAATSRPKRSSREAMRGDPERLAIRTKLLEVYAKAAGHQGLRAPGHAALRPRRTATARTGTRPGARRVDRPREPAVPAGRPARGAAPPGSGRPSEAIDQEHDAAVGLAVPRPASCRASRPRPPSLRSRAVDLDLDLDVVEARRSWGS
jgi:hypothetical protein